MRELLIATGNEHKFKEMGSEFEELGVRPLSLNNAGITLERPEAGDTYHENARIKAEEGHEKTGLPSLADDSGLEV
ncbi:MAG: non-canonical purine NTP pyrophosphatase, partial [bacterium]